MASDRAQTRPTARRAARPFLKWAGGKTQLLPFLRGFYPAEFGAYFEPFVRSGAVFLDLCGGEHLAGRRVRLMDRNADVIGCYLRVRDHVEQVIEQLERLALGHRRHGRHHFYDVRDARFNPLRQHLHARRHPTAAYTPELAAMLIYLNRTGFNGLFRLNSRGLFNVPAGSYVNPRICDADNLRRVAAALARPGLEIRHGSFESVRDEAATGDFVYLDPPYLPLSDTARFTSYTADGFDHDDHARLQQVVIALARKGCWVLLSNSTAPEITRLYAGDAEARRAGLQVHTVPARRAISSRASDRRGVLEYVITNVPSPA